jgi:hypothetical protein
MAAKRVNVNKGGRPSLGERTQFGVKLNKDDTEKVRLISLLDEKSYQDILAPFIEAGLTGIDLDELRAKADGQGTLDVAV